jgi:two-component system, chemotaxis family, CheB/CheR fusion protein
MVGNEGTTRSTEDQRLPASVPVPESSSLSAPDESRTLPDARVVHLALLERYTPASVLVDDEGRVLHYSVRAGRYLRAPDGEASPYLVRFLREPLRSAVRAGLDAVRRRERPWTSDALLVHTEKGVRRVAVHVDSANPSVPAAKVKLVVFEEVDAARGDDVPGTADYTSRLGSDLEEASRRLRDVVGTEDDGRHETELLGVLDDLDAARVELRTVDAELTTLDQDNRTRLEELARLSADLEVLLESTGLATLFLDRELKIVRFTPPLLDIFDVLPGDKGRPLADLAHRLIDTDLLGDSRRVLGDLMPIEREVEADNGKWYLVRMLPYRSGPQRLGGVAITLVDITTRKNAEQEIREADRRKDEFIALLAHELRNPLAPISAGIEILKRRELEPAIAERVTLTMGRQAAQLVRLIDDLLDVSRISSGRLQLRKTTVVLADIVRDAVAAVKPLIDRSGHALTVEVPPEPILLDADSARLTQVLANLLNNAARYTPNGGRIALSVRRDGESAVVTVRDNGCGIPASALPHVFEMFYQGADPRSSTQTGLGIGLALAKSLVDMHGGTIDAASAGQDRGSEFTLRVPALQQAGAARSDARSGAAAGLGGHRVLVVDDNADAARTLAMLIETLGENEVHVALSGEEALPLAERIKPDTVFLDLKMPDMDGYEVAQQLRREPWGTDAWLVALTGWGLDDHKRRTKEAGFDEHLTKPADRAALETILARPVGGRSERSGNSEQGV